MSFADFFAEIAQADFLVECQARLKALGVPVVQWLSAKNTGLALTMYVSEALAKLDAKRAGLQRSAFLDTAIGDGLTALARSHFRLERLERRFTQGKVVLTVVAGSGPYTITAGQLLVGTPGASESARSFTNTDGGTLDAGVNGGKLTITVQATAPGAASNVPLLSISELKTPLPGVSVSNPDYQASGTWITSAGSDGEYGVDGEPDEAGDLSLKRRCDLRWAVAGERYELPDGRVVVIIAAGTADAYEFWARYPVGGGTTTPVAKARILTNWANNAPLPQAVTVLIAGTGGALGAADVALVAANFEAPPKYPLGTKLFVRSAQPVSVTLVGTVFVRAGYSLADVQSQIIAGLAVLQARQQIGATLFLTAIIEAIQGANAAGIRNVALTAPLGDTAVAFDGIVTLVNQLAFVQVQA